MTLLRLFYEFFKTGLFSVGGGLATIPFLQDMGTRTGWFTPEELATMIAVSESTPGPVGVNMATYVGFHQGGVPGAVVATLGLVAPSIIVILLIAGFLEKFRRSRRVEAAFRGLRPASTALITAAGLSLAAGVLLRPLAGPAADAAALLRAVNWPAVLIAAAVFAGMKWTPLKKLHPVCFIAAAALAGILLKL